MVKLEHNRIWAKRMTLVGSFGSWLLLLPIVWGYLESGELLLSNNQDMVMFSFSLALIGLVSGIEIHVDNPCKEGIGHKGSTKLLTLCLFSSALLVLGICMFFLTPYSCVCS
ncbi:MAG: hypothetical protein KAS94_01395 [Desulfobulbaceae bacterium]|nr:hypothetical protein [Desulfobulbaceae bacterium]